ncbi:helix-turn-helix domain-containing protein [Mycobacterium sp. M23085]|uniref:helix-turn-helix domain-containing protein n=1 Tax=Mycobacterium sp. M23085 TaxID=3378087 RepID=UPI0038779170
MTYTYPEHAVTVHDTPEPRPSTPRRLLTIVEAAEALSISRSSIYRLFDAGQLAWVQIGGSRRVASAEIERFIAAHTEAAS